MYSSAARHTGRLTCPTAVRRFSKWSATWCLRGSDYLTVRIKNFAGAPLNNKLQPLRAHALFGAFAGRGVFPSFPPSPQCPGKKDSIEQKHQWSRLVENLPVEKPAKKTKKRDRRRILWNNLMLSQPTRPDKSSPLSPPPHLLSP